MLATESTPTRLHYMQAWYRTVKNLTIDDKDGSHIDIETAIILRSYDTDIVIYDVERNHAYFLPCYKCSKTTSRQRGRFLDECTSLPAGVYYMPKAEREQWITFLTNPHTNLWNFNPFLSFQSRLAML